MPAQGLDRRRPGRGRDRRRRAVPAAADRPAEVEAARPLLQLGQFVLRIGSPLAMMSGLMFYFGWVRTQVQARALGYDSAVLHLSTTGYLLKSVYVLFPVITSMLLLVILGYATFSAVAHRLLRSHRRNVLLERAHRAARIMTVLALLAGVACYVIPATRFAAIPVALTVAVLFGLAEGRMRPIVGKERWSATSQILVLALLALLLFWNTERIARTFGEQFAYDIAERPEQFPEVIVYSQNNLNIDAEGVHRQVLSSTAGEYRFRYRGLRLMEQIEDRYVFINEVWYDGKGRVILLRERDTLRFEFVDPY